MTVAGHGWPLAYSDGWVSAQGFDGRQARPSMAGLNVSSGPAVTNVWFFPSEATRHFGQHGLRMGTFAEDVVVHRAGVGRYDAELGHSWDLVPLPQGGIVVSFALRAAALEIDDPKQQLRTCTTVFAGQVAAGPLEVEVQVLRRGRTATQVVATVRKAGAAAGATTVAVFGSSREGPSFVEVVPPDVPSPSACRSYRDALPEGVEFPDPWPFWTRIEGRGALGHPPWEEHEPGASDVATWLRFDDPPLLDDGSLDPLGVVTLADRMPGCVAEHLGHQGRPFFAPSADLTVHLFEPLRTEWVLAHDRARWADDGWASAECSLWDEHGTLVAHASQMMLFTYIDDA
jgi:acyl-CoA thioesterase